MPALSCGGRDSRLPYWSTTVTSFFAMKGMEDETRCTIASTCWRDSERPFSICTKTEADGGVEARANTDFSGIAR